MMSKFAVAASLVILGASPVQAKIVTYAFSGVGQRIVESYTLGIADGSFQSNRIVDGEFKLTGKFVVDLSKLPSPIPSNDPNSFAFYRSRGDQSAPWLSSMVSGAETTSGETYQLSTSGNVTSDLRGTTTTTVFGGGLNLLADHKSIFFDQTEPNESGAYLVTFGGVLNTLSNGTGSFVLDGLKLPNFLASAGGERPLFSSTAWSETEQWEGDNLLFVRGEQRSYEAFVTVSVEETVTAVPEPQQWAMMIGGFAMAGAALRRHRVKANFA